MANSLVQTTFQAGPSDDLAAVDVYKNLSGKGIINRIQKLNVDASMLSGGGFGTPTNTNAANLLADLMRQTSNAIAGNKSARNQLLLTAGAAASKATSLLSGTPEQIKVNKESLLERLLEASSLVQSSMRRSNGSIMDAMMKDTPLRSALLVNVAGIKSKVSVADLRDVNSIGRLINDLSKSEAYSVADNGALAGIMGGIIGQAAKLGIPNAFDTITSTIEDNALLVAVIKTSLPHVIGSSNMEQLWSIANSPLGKVVNSIFPDLMPSVVKNYTWLPKVKQINRQAYTMQGMMDISSNINSSWNVTTRATKPTINMSVFVGGNQDFSDMIASTVPQVTKPEERVYGIATTFSKLTTRARLRRMFPSLPLTSLDRIVRVNAGVVSPNVA